MKTILFLILLATFSRAYAPNLSGVALSCPDAINPLENLYNACASVESGKNTNAINLKEQAYGIVQIRQGKLTDFNNETGKNYTLTDCLDADVSREVWMHFAGKYDYRDAETIARKWNGAGEMTVQYWNKVKTKL